MRILLIQLRQLGDILLTTPMIRCLRQVYPEAKIDFLSHKMGTLVLKHNLLIDTHLIYPQTKSFVKHLAFVATLRSNKYDLVLDFMNNPRSAFLTRVTGAQARIGFKGVRAWAYTKSFKRAQNSEYIVATKQRLLESMQNSNSQPLPSLDLPYQKVDLTKAHQFFAKKDFNRVQVVLSPTHRRERRRWRAQRFAKLADFLSDRYQAQVCWAWGPGEREFVADISKSCRTNTELLPETSFPELAAFFSHFDLFIGTSNGPSHVAVASGCPSLQLHGHTDAVSWCPNTNMHRYIQSTEFGNSDATLDSISLEEVQIFLDEWWPEIEAIKTKRFPHSRKVLEWRPSSLSFE